jgi:NNP family nitrate/nitrite transporter-like MFS transporter
MMGLGVTATIGIFTMLPLYLVKDRGLDPNWVNTLIGISYASCIGMVFLAGWATDRFGPKVIMGVVFFVTGIVTVLLGTAPNSWLSIIVFFQAMLACCFFPAGFAALSRIGSADTRNVTISVSTPMAGTFGAGIIPTGLGIMGDAGFFGLGIALAGGLIFTGFLIALYLKLPE